MEAWVRGPDGPRRFRVARFRVPASWTGDRERDRRSLWLSGPNGEGAMFIGLGLHPEDLGAFLDELARRTPASAPSPPEPYDLPFLNAALGDRATRYVVTGKMAGEMVLIERRGVILLFAAIVHPSAWDSVSGWLPDVYRSVILSDGAP
ncbi:MAG: hypothetical protein HC923_10305 [Myxococcales bacterium]|nr:hypothetical protein [Myxococcales bacterium]